MVLDDNYMQELSPFKQWMAKLGFRWFKWFRRWCGGRWYKTCSFDVFIREQINPTGRYPKRYVSKAGFVLDFEDYTI